MARKIASKIAKEAAARAAAKKGRNAPQSRAISGAPEKGTVGAMKKPKAKPATTKKRSARATKTKTTPATKAKGNVQAAKTIASPTARRRNARASKVPTVVKAAAVAAPAAGLATMFTRKGEPKPTDMTFGEAFKAARKKGEGTKFTYKGKQYSAVTKDDLKKKGYDANELKQYMNRKGKARGPLNRLGQGVKKVLLGKDKKFGGDKGAIDFIRRPKKKAAGGMANSKPKKFKAGGMATKGLGKAYMKSKR